MTINYNVTGPDRKSLVKAIENFTGLKSKYLGAPSMAYQIGAFQVSKLGALSFEDEGNAENLIEALCEHGFTGKVLLPEGCEPAEDDEAFFSASIPKESLTPGERENLANIVKAKGALIKKAVEASELPILEGNDDLAFPWFHAEVSAEEAHAYTELISKLCAYARSHKKVTSVEKEVDNEKYAFRCFLLRLGFIGDEYKGDRKVLLRNFTGSGAFKCGHKKGYAPGLAPIPTSENTVKLDVKKALLNLKNPDVQAEIREILNGEDGDEE